MLAGAKFTEEATRTFSLELRRAPAIGILETALTTFGVLILIKGFEANAFSKAVLLGSARAGLVASILVIPLLRRSGLGLPRLVALLHCGAGTGFLTAALFPESLTAFVSGVSLGLFGFALQTPLLTQLYRDNFPETIRGRLFSIIGLVRALASIVFSYLGGRLLGVEIAWYQLLLFIFSGGAFYSAILFSRLPHRGHPVATTRPISAALNSLRENREFRLLIISWMALGMGNLMAMSLFVEYLANPRFGFAMTAATIAVMTGVFPPLAKLVTTYPMGVLFDRVHFYRLRLMLNGVIMVMILIFYLGGGMVTACIGLVLHGISLAGGNVIWSLWVTRVAPAERVAEYMSVHTFMTGLRGTLAPVFAYCLISRISVPSFAAVCTLLVLVGSLLLLPQAWRGDKNERKEPKTS